MSVEWVSAVLWNHVRFAFWKDLAFKWNLMGGYPDWSQQTAFIDYYSLRENSSSWTSSDGWRTEYEDVRCAQGDSSIGLYHPTDNSKERKTGRSDLGRRLSKYILSAYT